MTPMELRRWTKETRLELSQDAMRHLVQHGRDLQIDDGTIEMVRERANQGLPPVYFTISCDDGSTTPYFWMHDPVTGEVISKTVAGIEYLEPCLEPSEAEVRRHDLVRKIRRVKESSVYEGWVRNTLQSKKAYTIEGDLLEIIDFLTGE